MFELNYDNVMKGFNKGLHMTCVCFNRQHARELFERALDLWYIEGVCNPHVEMLSFDYGLPGEQIALRFKGADQLKGSSFRGFRGIYLIYEDLRKPGTMFSINEMIMELDQHNERYYEQWQA